MTEEEVLALVAIARDPNSTEAQVFEAATRILDAAGYLPEIVELAHSFEAECNRATEKILLKELGENDNEQGTQLHQQFNMVVHLHQ